MYNEELVLISSQGFEIVVPERGLMVPVNGVKMIMRYPVDSSYFSRTKLKIKLEGDDYLFGETTIGRLGTIAFTLHNSEAINKNVKMAKE